MSKPPHDQDLAGAVDAEHDSAAPGEPLPGEPLPGEPLGKLSGPGASGLGAHTGDERRDLNSRVAGAEASATPDDDDEIIPISEMARIADVHPATLRRYWTQGEMDPPMYLGPNRRGEWKRSFCGGLRRGQEVVSEARRHKEKAATGNQTPFPASGERMTCIVAIDPGVTGALAFYFVDVPDRVSVLDMPLVDGEVNPDALRDLINTYKPSCAIIEHVGPMPRDGVRQAWRFSAAFTVGKTAVALLDIPMTLVPGTWKKAMKVTGGFAGKEECRAKAIQMFPACAASFARKRDRGRAEAALLALHAAQLTSRRAAA